MIIQSNITINIVVPSKGKKIEHDKMILHEYIKKVTRMSVDKMYFGTENVMDSLKNGLNPVLTGFSDKQTFGSGFYFYSTPDAAENEIGFQGLRVINPAVMVSTVSLNNPIRLKPGAASIHEAQVKVTPQQIFEIMKVNPRLLDSVDSPILEWEGQQRHRISKELITEICHHFAKPENFWKMESQMFEEAGEAKLFRAAVKANLGYDGVVIELGNGKANMVSWFPEQVEKLEIHKIMPKPDEQLTRLTIPKESEFTPSVRPKH